MLGPGQAAVHDVPQLLDVEGLSHVPLQLSVPLGQTHEPLTHCCPVPHVLPHVPQLLVSVCVLVHAEPHRFGVAVGQAQVPLWQLWAEGHAWPQVPQLLRSVVSASQAPLQLVRPLLQLIPQVDPLQIAVPTEAPLLGPAQAAVHDVPQLLDVAGLSHVPLQLSVPLGHTHDPLTHCCPAPHVLLHVPQLLVSVIVLVHVEPHRLGFDELGHVHTPLWQLWTEGHAWLHAPQFCPSVFVFVHTLPQKLGSAADGHAHAPDWHVSAAGHARPQAPQLPGSLISVEQVPLQLVCPVEHPLVHANVAPDGLQTDVEPEQAAPQLAQFDVVPRAVAQPVPVLPQSANPAAHVYEHFPAEQARPVVLTCVSCAQVVPHAPQLSTSVPSTLTHAPLQSVCPVEQLHTPALHVCPVLQACPQLPQLALSVCSFVQAVPQRSGSAAVGHWHVPLVHTSYDGHAIAHVPQWFESDERVAHVPSQFVWPAVHPFAHAYAPASPDAVHTGVVPVQLTAHPPQFDFEEKSVAHPVPASAQSP